MYTFLMNSIIITNLRERCNKLRTPRLRKFIFGKIGVESTHDALIKYQAMTCGLTILFLRITSKPDFKRAPYGLFLLGVLLTEGFQLSMLLRTALRLWY